MHLGAEELEIMDVKKLFMNSECPLLEIYTNENENVRCSTISSGNEIQNEARRMDNNREVKVRFTAIDEVKEPKS